MGAPRSHLLAAHRRGGVRQLRAHRGVAGARPRRSGERIVLPTTVLRADPPEALVGQRRLRFTAVLAPGRSCSGGSSDPSSSTPTSPREVWPYPDPLDLRVRRLAPRGRLITPASVFSDGAQAGELHAYRTFKAGVLAFEFRPLDPDAVAAGPHARGGAARLLRWRTRHRPVWLVGERPETAQDTGVALFEHLREAHPEIDARYVITRDSPDLARVADDPNTVMFGSRRARRVGPGGATHPRLAPQRVPAAGPGTEVRAQRQGHPGLPPARGHGHQEHGRQLRLRRTGIHRRRVHRQLRTRAPDDRGRLRLALPSACSSPAWHVTTGSSPRTRPPSVASW